MAKACAGAFVRARTHTTSTGPFPRSFVSHQGPYSWKILVLGVSPSNNILRKYLEIWAFPLKIKEKILVKKKVIQKAFNL